MCVCTQLPQLCPTLCSPVDYNSPPPQGSSVHGDSPGKNTGVGCHALLQGIFPTQGLNRCLLCLLHWQVGYTSATWEAPYAYTCIYPIHTQKHINIHVLHFIVFCTYWFVQVEGVWQLCICTIFLRAFAQLMSLCHIC